MDGRQSAYAALGLLPGADRAQIEDAYRRLIKLHHPDRPGGDGGRAAEINRAYRELRDRSDTLPVRVQAPPLQRRRSRSGRILTSCLVLACVLLIGRYSGLFGPSRSAMAGIAPVMAAAREDSAATSLTPLDDFEEPLSTRVIDRSVSDALRLYSHGNGGSLAAYSRGCQSQFRNHPDVVWFDSCAAFDEAVVLLQSRDPVADSGPFDPAAVTGRELGAASLLSDDSLAADSRLHKIRSRVEFVLVTKSQP